MIQSIPTVKADNVVYFNQHLLLVQEISARIKQLYAISRSQKGCNVPPYFIRFIYSPIMVGKLLVRNLYKLFVEEGADFCVGWVKGKKFYLGLAG